MLLVLTELSSHTIFVVRSQLTIPIIHTVAGSFLARTELTPFQERLRSLIAAPDALMTYCIDMMPGSAALITFSTLESPRTYVYKGKAVRIRPPDASSFSLLAQESVLQREPNTLTTSRRGYVQ
jgi:hypothetical protein